MALKTFKYCEVLPEASSWNNTAVDCELSRETVNECAPFILVPISCHCLYLNKTKVELPEEVFVSALKSILTVFVSMALCRESISPLGAYTSIVSKDNIGVSGVGGLFVLVGVSLPQAARLNKKNAVKTIATAITNRFRNSKGFIKVFIKYCFDLLKNNKNRLNFKMQLNGNINLRLSAI